MTAAKSNFDKHIAQCYEAMQIYDFLAKNRYQADFGLRFIWVAAISALDHYVSELIIERATEHFANGKLLCSRLLVEGVPIASALKIQAVSSVQATIEFRKIIGQAVRFKTFQKADDVSDGLAFIWNEDHKWNRIAYVLGMENKNAKRKLNSIAYRRDSIVHSADFDESGGALRECKRSDAGEAADYVRRVVEAIDQLIQ